MSRLFNPVQERDSYRIDPLYHKDRTTVHCPGWSDAGWRCTMRILKDTDHSERRVNTGIPYEEYWQRQRERFWQQAYLRAYEITLTQPETIPAHFSRHGQDRGHDVAFWAAEKALHNLDLTRRQGQLAKKYYF